MDFSFYTTFYHSQIVEEDSFSNRKEKYTKMKDMEMNIYYYFCFCNEIQFIHDYKMKKSGRDFANLK